MFSTKVITAVQILQTLEASRDKYEGVRGVRRLGVLQKDLFAICSTPTSMVATVLKTLLKIQWVSRNSANGYYIIVSLKEVSLYDLYQVLHLGLSLGESLSINAAAGSHRISNIWKRLTEVENILAKEIVVKFKSIPVENLICVQGGMDAQLSLVL